MKESLWGYYLVLLGITVTTVMVMVSNMTTTNQQNYYLLKEVTNAAMIDAMDYGYYREYGIMKINTEKFVENFLRRFSEGISKTNTYKIEFYSIYENPPSVSIRVTSNTGDYNIAGDSTNVDVINTIDAIMETNNTIAVSENYYSVPYDWCNESKYISDNISDEDYGYCQLSIRSKLKFDNGFAKNIAGKIQEKLPDGEVVDYSKIKVLDIEFLKVMNSQDETNAYHEFYDSVYDREVSDDDIPATIESEGHLAVNVKDVKVTMQEKNGDYYLAYGLKFNCDKDSIGDNKIVYSGFDGKPYNGNCSIGIKYRVNYYYQID